VLSLADNRYAMLFPSASGIVFIAYSFIQELKVTLAPDNLLVAPGLQRGLSPEQVKTLFIVRDDIDTQACSR